MLQFISQVPGAVVTHQTNRFTDVLLKVGQAGVKAAMATAFCAIPLLATPALADDRDFTLVNDSKMVVNELYVSTVQTDDWEEDVLGSDVLDSGASTTVNFDAGVSGNCFYDIKIVAGGSREFTGSHINLCEASSVIFTGKGLTSR
jgi:hypothetical protein